MLTRLMLATISLLVTSTSGFAAPRAGRLTGTVLNAKGTPVAALVLWQAADGTAPNAVRTDAHGRFRVTDLRSGMYDLRAETKGHWSDWLQNVVVRPGYQVRVTLRLGRATPPVAPRHRTARK